MYARGAFLFQWLTLAVTLLILAMLWFPRFGVTGSVLGRSQVAGQVTYNGKPVTNRAIVFQPKENPNEDWGAAALDADGKFALNNRNGEFMLAPGRYNVFFIVQRRAPTTLTLPSTGTQDKSEKSEQPAEATRAVETDPSPLPAKYLKADSSGLWIDIGRDPSRMIIELKD